MTSHSSRSCRLLAGLLSFLTLASCSTPPYYTGPAPGGGFYAPQTQPSWDINWGLVKRSKTGMPDFLKKLRGGGDPDAYWHGDGVPGRPRITIDLSDQVAYFHKGDKLVGSSPICTGSAQFPTPKGNFSVTEKDADHYSSVYGDWVDQHGAVLQTQIDNRKDPRPPGARFDGAKMFWFLRVNGGVGMHEGYLPGYADSHGCIRLPSDMAKIYYENAPVGTPVKIVD